MVIGGRGVTLALAAAGLAMAALPWFAPPYYLQLGAYAAVAAMFALSLQLLVGGAGLVSLGHAGFFGLGGYAIFLLAPLGVSSIAATLPAAALLAGLVALALGSLAVRTQGFFFLMTTLAFGQMLFFLFHDTKLGGGADGAFVTRPSYGAFGLEYVVGRRDRPAVLLWTNLAVLAAMYAGLAGLMRTLFGRALLGIAANPHRMRALGFPVRRYQLAAFTLAGALAGVAGHMFVLTGAFVNPELLGWHRSAEALLMLLLGGAGALHGPVVGALAFTALVELGQLVTDRQRLVEGLAILAAVLFLPGGLVGLRRR